MAQHLLDNTNIANVHFTNSVSFDSTWGIRFGCSAAITITGVRWYRDDPNVNRDLHGLRLYDASDALLWSTLVQVDTHTVGWQTTELPTPIELPAGGPYKVCFDFPGGHVWNYFLRADVGAPASPLLLDDNAECFRFASYGVPDTSRNIDIPAVDIEIGGPSGGPTGGGGTGTTADLAAWLSSSADVNTHEGDGLPWLTKALLDAWNSGLGAGAVGYFQFMKTAINAVKERTDRLPDSIEALTNAILTNASDNVDLVLGGLATIQAGVDALTGGSGGTAGGALGALSGRSAFPAEGWSLADETDWDTDLAWPVAADLYVFTVTTPPPGAAADSFAGVTWYHRLGSWTTLDGDQAGARAFLEFSPQQLQDGGRRMPGLALRTKNGTLGHVQAWLLA
jgi:hypothetical protein